MPGRQKLSRGHQSIINAAKAGGANVLLMTGNPSRIDIIADATQQQFRQALKDIVIANNPPNELLYTDLGAFLANSLKTWAV